MKKIKFFNILFIFTLFGLGAPRQGWSIPDNQVIAVYGTDELGTGIKKAIVANVNGDIVQDLVVCVPYYKKDADAGCVEADEGDPYDSSDDVAGSDPNDPDCDGYDGGAVVIFTSRLMGGARVAVDEATYEIEGSANDATNDRTETLSGPNIVIFSENVNFAHSCANARDVNNDGYDDLLIGDPYDSDSASAAGAVYLLLGSSSLVSTSASSLVKYTGEARDDYAGNSVAGAGDVNNDGYDDMLISAYANDDGGSAAGAAYLVLGSASPASAALSSAVKYTGEAINNYAGNSVAGAGDVNNDGYDDLLIGAYNNGDGGSQAGAAYLVLGSSSPASSSLSSAVEYTGEASSDQAGYSVAGAGDVNNDGYADMLIGAYQNDDWGTSSGAAYLVLGSASPTSASLSAKSQFSCNTSGDYCGMSVAGVGDTNGDGYDDLLIGAQYDDGGTSDQLGGAFLVYGGSVMKKNVSLPVPPKLGRKFFGNSDGDFFGGYVSGAGDYNGDGKNDIIVGASSEDVESSSSNEGAVYLILRPNLPSGADRTMPEL